MMNIKLLRSIHLYLGCFFAPLLIFFIVTGCLQMNYFHQTKKDGSYKAPAVIKSMSEVHVHQRWNSDSKYPPSSKGFRWMVLLMSIGMTFSTVLGVVLAFKYTKAWMVWVSLSAGILVPTMFLWIRFIS